MQQAEVSQEKVLEYDKVFEEKKYDKRSEKAQNASDTFYSLVTEFYERGWGESFHFAPRYDKEDLKSGIIRHEHFLALKLRLSPNDKVLDVGCGVMGPARNIARVSGAQITGLTINRHQVERCKILNNESSVSHLLNVCEGDFMDIPFPDHSFDKIYAIEALCHAPNISDVFKQIFKKLKPGGRACFYEWALTDRYDASNPEHVRIKKMIEYGNGVCELNTIGQIDQAIAETGFIVEEAVNLVSTDHYGNHVPWYMPLKAEWSTSQFKYTKPARAFTRFMLRLSERFGLVPKGVSAAHKILLTAADGLVAAGELDIFTPMYMLVVSKAS